MSVRASRALLGVRVDDKDLQVAVPWPPACASKASDIGVDMQTFYFCLCQNSAPHKQLSLCSEPLGT